MGAALCGLVGMVAGMLVNLGADLLPSRKPLREALRCPACETRMVQRRWPAIVALLLAPQCSHCGARQVWRPLGVELVMAGLWAYAWYHFGPSAQLWLFCVHSLVFVLVFVIDLEHRLVLNRVVLGGITLALACSLIWSSPPLARSALGGLSGFAIFLLIAMAKPGGMGAGDVKLAGLIGLVVGYPSVLSTLFTGIIVGGIGAAVLLILRRVRKGGYLPYGPFMVVGVLASLLRGEGM